MEKNEDNSSELFKDKRSQFAVEIRRKKKEEIINFKRFKMLEEKKLSDLKDFKNDDSHVRKIADDFFESLNQKNVQATTSATAEIKISLSHPQAPREAFVLYFIDKGIVKYLIDFLKENYCVYPDLQNEAAWALCNITAINSQACEYCLKNQILTNLLKALDFAKDDFLDNCLWTLANIAGDSIIGVRGALLGIGLVDHLAKLIKNSADRVLRIRTSIWLISNLAHGKPYPSAKEFIEAIPVIDQLLLSKDTETVEFCLWTISYLTETDQETNLNFFSDTEITSKVIRLLEDHRSPELQWLALRYLGNVSLGENNHIYELIKGGFLNWTIETLMQLKAKTKKIVLWILSNVCATNVEFIEEMLASELPNMLMKIVSEEEEGIRIEGMYCLKNMLMIATKEQIQELVSRNIIESIMVNLEIHHDTLLIETTLNCLCKLLQVGELISGSKNALNPHVKIMCEASSMHFIESLQKHENEKIFQMVNCLIDEFFNPSTSNSEDNLMRE